jgi:hypothetical protein
LSNLPLRCLLLLGFDHESNCLAVAFALLCPLSIRFSYIDVMKPP